MPAKDIYHDVVRTALEKDGWTITADPPTQKIGRRSVLVDLGAEKLIAAEQAGQKIAVEIKSFLSPSPLRDQGKRSRTIYSVFSDLASPP